MSCKSDIHIKAKESMLFDIIKLLNDSNLTNSIKTKKIKDGYVYIYLPSLIWYNSFLSYYYDYMIKVNSFFDEQNNAVMIVIREDLDIQKYGNCSPIDLIY